MLCLVLDRITKFLGINNDFTDHMFSDDMIFVRTLVTAIALFAPNLVIAYIARCLLLALVYDVRGESLSCSKFIFMVSYLYMVLFHISPYFADTLILYSNPIKMAVLPNGRILDFPGDLQNNSPSQMTAPRSDPYILDGHRHPNRLPPVETPIGYTGGLIPYQEIPEPVRSLPPFNALAHNVYPDS